MINICHKCGKMSYRDMHTVTLHARDATVPATKGDQAFQVQVCHACHQSEALKDSTYFTMVRKMQDELESSIRRHLQPMVGRVLHITGDGANDAKIVSFANDEEAKDVFDGLRHLLEGAAIGIVDRVKQFELEKEHRVNQYKVLSAKQNSKDPTKIDCLFEIPAEDAVLFGLDQVRADYSMGASRAGQPKTVVSK